MNIIFDKFSNNLFAAALIAIFLTVTWYSVNDYAGFIANQQELAQRSADNTAREIEVLIAGRKNSVRLFADRERDLLALLVKHPEDTEAQSLLQSRVDAYFPNRLAVTVANEKGDPLLKQGNKLVGKTCRRDIALFFADPGSQLIHVHPSPGTSRLHFDILSNTSDIIQDKSVFFISFFLDDLFRILAHGQIVGHQLVLVRTSQPEFIEAPTDNNIARLEELAGELEQVPSAKPSMLRRIWKTELNKHVLATATIKDTQWELRDVAQYGLVEKRRNALIAQAAGIMLVFLLVTVAGLRLTRRLEISRGNTNAVLLRIEDERKRIAMDLHDQVLSDISHVRRECQTLSDNGKTGSGDGEPGNIERELNKVTDTIRHVINDLHPPSLGLLGFAEAVRAYCDTELQHYDNIEINLDIEGWQDDRLDDTSKLHLFRILQESVDNVIRHANASQCDIQLKMTGRSMELVVEDNGSGYTNDKSDLNPRHGIANIKERSRMLGARVDWLARKNQSGTCFALKMTLPDE